MRRRIPVVVRVALGVGVIVVVGLLLLGYLGDYREATGERSTDSTASVDATPTAGATGTVEASGPAAPPAIQVKKQFVVVQIEGLNFRTEPKAGAQVIKGLSKGEKLTWIATESGWYRAADEDGKEGWVSANPQYAVLEK